MDDGSDDARVCGSAQTSWGERGVGSDSRAVRYNECMRVLFVAAEVGPYVSVGGLSQVSYFLPKSLNKLGNDVRIFTPKFGAMDHSAKGAKGWNLKMETAGLHVPLRQKLDKDDLICNVKSYQKKGGVKTYFLENREYYELRENVFGYKDDHVRFMLLSKGCLEWVLITGKKWMPEVIHCNDWHSAYLIELARTLPRYREFFKKVKIVLTVHNFLYQGNFDYKYCEEQDRDYGKYRLASLLSPRLQKQNALLRGILYADAISTVSPTHAREVITEEYGEGLNQVLYKKRKKLMGILNGLDVNTFDPGADKTLRARYGAASFVEQRAINKRYLQRFFNLPTNPESFLISYVGRLTQQKGLPLIIEAAPHLLATYPHLQLIVLGGGDDTYRRELSLIQEQYPKQVGLYLMPDFKLPRKIFAGADALLMPSMFEPGGIVALEAMRYGAVPIVRRTGGLNDIVSDFLTDAQSGTGFSFATADAWSLYGAITAAMTIFSRKELWHLLIKNCLSSDFSWDFVATEYQKWYERVETTL